jgi:hypothetical protein
LSRKAREMGAGARAAKTTSVNFAALGLAPPLSSFSHLGEEEAGGRGLGGQVGHEFLKELLRDGER